MLMATHDSYLVRWLNGCHRAQVYQVNANGYVGNHQWHFTNRYSSGVCVIGAVKGDAIEAARVLMGIGEDRN